MSLISRRDLEDDVEMIFCHMVLPMGINVIFLEDKPALYKNVYKITEMGFIPNKNKRQGNPGRDYEVLRIKIEK